MIEFGTINSAGKMIAAIREIGIIPFFRSPVRGWSIEELTHPDWWFYSSEELGPWDWKIEAVREGDIAYGKFLSNKAAFATVEWYRHLMNWRRSLPQYRVATGEKFEAKTASARLLKHLSPIALDVIRKRGTLETSELRALCGERLTDYRIRQIGSKYETSLKPAVKKSVMDSVLQFLDMGTWTVIGDFRRIYRGPNLEYTGWQRSSITTPDELFGTPDTQSAERQFWTKFLEDENDNLFLTDCTPEESRQILIGHLTGLYPGEKPQFEKILK